MEYTLVLTFVNTAGDKSNINIPGVKSDITKDQITTLMDTILAKNIFLVKGSAFASKYGAQLTQRTTTKFEF